MKCSNCGNELEAGSRFCGSCGSPVNVPGPLSFDPPPAYIQSPAAGRPKSRRLLPLIIGSILIIALIVTIVLISAGGKNKSEYDFPSNEESVYLTKAIQGEWTYSGEKKSYSLKFEGLQDFVLDVDYPENYLSSSSGYFEMGRYAIDTEKDIIYLIYDETREGEEEAFDVIYDYNETTGSIKLYYNGVELSK